MYILNIITAMTIIYYIAGLIFRHAICKQTVEGLSAQRQELISSGGRTTSGAIEYNICGYFFYNQCIY